jgi:DNA-binding NarL/FixJ family response regulator
MIRVVLIDDQALIRSGIRALLDAEDDIEVVAEAADGQQGVALVRDHRPDIALMDVQMPVLDGIEATRQIVEDHQLAGVRVVILTNYGLDEYIFRALRAGASGFLLKDTEPAELLQALRVVMREMRCSHPRLPGAWSANLSPGHQMPAPARGWRY